MSTPTTTPKPYTPQQVLNNLRKFVQELDGCPINLEGGPGYVLGVCHDILKRGIEPSVPVSIVLRLLDCPDVNEDFLSPETIAACDQARAAIHAVHK